MPAGDRLGFRPDLEGLRAIAVGLVLLYHARVPGFSGGYVGVDVFYVLSGFLITGLIVRELNETGHLSLPAFYARRARRILPAAMFVLLATVVAAAVALPPLRVPDLVGDSIAAGLYVSNIRFALQATDYLQSQQDPSPLLHYWSLAVEEQFYLLWPALLLLVWLSGGRTRRLGAVVLFLAVASLAASIVVTDLAAPWGFFSLPTRAWELGIGAILAIGAARVALLPRRLAATAAAAGLGLIVLAGVAFDDATAFPGIAALIPTAGAGLFIAAGLPSPLVAPSRMLAFAPFRWLGRISYSLYLWHWPVVVIPAALATGEISLRYRVALLLLSVVLAAASYQWIEEPVRRGRIVGLRPAGALALAAGSIALVVTTSLASGVWADSRLSAGATAASPASSLAPSSGTPTVSSGPTARPRTAGGPVPADLTPSLLRARDDLPVVYSDGCHLNAEATTPPECAFGVPTSSRTVVLFGDSHAAQWFPALEALSASQGWRLVSLTKSGCPSVDVTIWHTTLKRVYTECDQWRRIALERIAVEHAAVVVVSNAGAHPLWVNGNVLDALKNPDLWATGLRKTLEALRAIGTKAVLIEDTPRSRFDPPVCLSSHPLDVLACATDLRRALAQRTEVEGAVAAEFGDRWIDPVSLVCPSDPCPVVIRDLLVYRDSHHLTATFARDLAEALRPLITEP